MAYNIFISYSSKDKVIANQVCNAISNEYVRVFIDEQAISYGENIPQKIIKAINSCDLFVLLWSQNARNSDWVQQEIGITKARNKKILPLLLHRGITLPAFIQELKYLPVYENPIDAYSWLQQHIFNRTKKKEENNTLIGLGLSATLLYFLNKGDEENDEDVEEVC